MNKNLNLVNILKDCPKGTKLYSILFGGVEFKYIKYNKIFVTDKKGFTRVFTRNGAWDCTHADVDECLLFPSKDQRDWSKFKVEPEMIDGEFYYCFYGDNQKENRFIFIYKKHPLYKTKCYVALGILSSILFKDDIIASNNSITELRRATEKEKKQLLNAIKTRNYEWDTDKKALIKIEPKFNISSFQPFDKVLVRDCVAYKWRCDFFESYIKGADLPFRTLNGWYKQCIPYNNETKHLVGTTEMPPKKYITWEE